MKYNDWNKTENIYQQINDFECEIVGDKYEYMLVPVLYSTVVDLTVYGTVPYATVQVPYGTVPYGTVRAVTYRAVP
jgi:hypothetical protein